MADFGKFARASRVSYRHPLRHDVPLEVLTLNLLRVSCSPFEMRAAVDALATLLASGKTDEFCSAMSTIDHWREIYLDAKGLDRGVFPVVAVHVDSVAALESAEQFFGAPSTCPTRLELFLRVRLDSHDCHGVRGYERLQRVRLVLQSLRDQESRFQFSIVELDFLNCFFADDDIVNAVTQVFALALHDASQTPAFKVSFRLSEGASFMTWGKLFQTVCRVGYDDLLLGEKCAGNELVVAVDRVADVRLVAGLWSAVAFSRGYSHLGINSIEPNRQDEEVDGVNAMYTAFALLSQDNDISSLKWDKPTISTLEVSVMEQIKLASSTSFEAVLDVLSERSPEFSSSGAVELDCLNRGIVKKFGVRLNSATDGPNIHLLVPGFAPCYITKEEWTEIPRRHSICLGDAKLARLHIVMTSQSDNLCASATRLFSIVGSSLRFLVVEFPILDPVDPLLLLSITCACPELKELRVTPVQLARRPVVIDASQVVSKSIVKVDLEFFDPTDEPSTSFTEEFLGSLIPLVGAKMEYLDLHIEPSGIIPFSQAFTSIVQSCTSLFHLKLEHLDVGSLDALIDSYTQGTSRISSLYLRQCPVTSESLVRFARFLSDSANPGSKKLGVFHVEQVSRDAGDQSMLQGLDATSIRSMLTMLEMNKTMTELYLRVCDARIGEEPLRPFKRRFAAHDEEPIPVSSEKFPIESTLAFVDALHRQHLPYNQETVALITQFACRRVCRSVRYEVVDEQIDAQ